MATNPTTDEGWRQEIARRGEDLAARYLEAQGVTLVARNVRTRHGELDLIGRAGGTLLVGEVRTVWQARFLGHPGASITLTTARQVLRATRQLVASWGLRGCDLRIDAIGVELSTGRVEHLPGGIRWDLERPERSDRWRCRGRGRGPG